MSRPNPFLLERTSRLRRKLRQRDLRAYLVTNPLDVGYLSGFKGDDSWLVAGEGKGWLLTDFRYEEQAEAECPDLGRVVRRGTMIEGLAGIVRRKRITRLGYDPDSVTVSLLKRLRKGLKKVRLEPVEGLVSGMRVRKDASEIRAIEKAVRVAGAAWAEFRRRIRLGMTEMELAAEMEYQIRRAGAEAPAFPTIVGIDATASLPHARPGSRRLGRDSLVLVDFGAKVDGYVCDLTRVVFTGKILPFIRQVYDLVFKAQAAAIAQVRPGATYVEVDTAARRMIAEAGFAEAFRHGLGHGIGRQVHEAPALAPKGPKGRLEPGMVVTIEPGVYLKGRFGVRIEDDVLVTETGHRVLTQVEKNLDDMVL